MLKVCWDCLAGNRYENDAYSNGTALNRDTFSTPWPTQLQNEIMFRLPRELSSGDKINISGIRLNDRESFVINLMTGIDKPDHQNIACKFEADYDTNEEQLILSTIQNGQKKSSVVDDKPSDYFPGPHFDVSFKLRLYEDTYIFDINAGVTFVDTVTLTHNLRDITYITVSPDTININELKFSFS